MKHKEKATEPFFATSMGDMGGNIGDTPENEVLWDLDRTSAPKAPKSGSR